MSGRRAAENTTIRALLTAADDLLTFGHDPVEGSWTVPPDAGAVHLAGSFVHRALAILDNADRVEHFPEGWCEVSDDHPRGDTCRVVPDPVRLVGRVEPHDDNGDTT